MKYNIPTFIAGIRFKAYFPLGDFVRFAQREAKRRVRQRDWLQLVSENQVRTVLCMVIGHNFKNVMQVAQCESHQTF